MTWSGSANVGLKYSDNGTTTVHEEIDLGMTATGETDGGIGWKVEMGLDSSNADSTPAGAADVGSVHLSGDFGTIKVGNVSSAGTSIGLPDVGFDTIGIDDAAELGRNSKTTDTSMDVRWKYAMDDIALDVSIDTANDDMAVGMSWSSGALSIAVSQAAISGGASATAASIGTSVGGFAVSLMAANHQTAGKDSVGMSASMPVDGFGTVTFVTGSNDTDAKSSWGLGFSKSLGGGASLAGAYGSANGNDKADLGISLSF
jgi:outer membrane protein OmpU